MVIVIVICLNSLIEYLKHSLIITPNTSKIIVMNKIVPLLSVALLSTSCVFKPDFRRFIKKLSKKDFVLIKQTPAEKFYFTGNSSTYSISLNSEFNGEFYIKNKIKINSNYVVDGLHHCSVTYKTNSMLVEHTVTYGLFNDTYDCEPYYLPAVTDMSSSELKSKVTYLCRQSIVQFNSYVKNNYYFGCKDIGLFPNQI